MVKSPTLRLRRALSLCLLLGLGAALRLGCQGAGNPPDAAPLSLSANAWGTLDPLTRLLPVDRYGGPLNGALVLAGARNEVVDGQIVLLAARRPWAGVTLTFSGLRGPNGARLPASLLHWRRVGLVRTRQPYYQTRYVGLWPDPLLPPAPFDIPAQGRAFCWIDGRVPDATTPGVYSGTVTVSSQGSAPKRIPLTLRVWGFILPHQNHLQTSFGVQGQGAFPLDTGALYDDMLAHRISPLLCVSDPQRRSPATPGGPDQWDWTAFDRDFPQRLAQGMTAFDAHLDQNNPPAAIWQAHLQEKGWLPLAYTYIADEPTGGQLPALNSQLAQVRQVAPRLRNLMTARGYPSELSNVDIWCPNIAFFDPGISRREQARGRESWWYPAYPTRHPQINVWTDYPALDCRVWPWMTWKYNLDGMLYWSVCYWANTPDPLAQASAFFGSDGAANGDGALVYPGPGGRPLDSIRWEALRDGLQDYEVFCVLEAGVRDLQATHKSPDLARQAQALLAIDARVVASYQDYNPDPHALLVARQQMSATLEKIVKALGHEPRVTAHPRRHPEIAALQAQALAASASPRR